jgi:excisionase family DNA binding protein
VAKFVAYCQSMDANTNRDMTLATSIEVSQYTQVPLGTLDQWAHRGVGPRYIKVGRHRRYRWADVDAWLDANTVDQDRRTRPALGA